MQYVNRRNISIGLLRQACFLGSVVLFCIMATCIQGALLVYEGFNGYGATGSGIGTPLPNANTVGLSKTTNYRSTGWTIADGLTFGTLETNGGAVNFSNAQTYLSTQLDLDNNPANTSSYTGTLYSSYLVNMSSLVSGGGVQLRVADVFGNTTGTRFFSDADTRQSVTTNAAVGYNGTVASTGKDLALNTTYLVISRFTNVGLSLSSETQGVATMFILTEAQFANLTSQSDWELYLDDPSTTVGNEDDEIFAKATTSGLQTGTYTFDDSDYVHFLAVANGVFDEFRYGDSLASVLPTVPEPTAGMLAVLGGSLVLLRRKRYILAAV